MANLARVSRKIMMMVLESLAEIVMGGCMLMGMTRILLIVMVMLMQTVKVMNMMIMTIQGLRR